MILRHATAFASGGSCNHAGASIYQLDGLAPHSDLVPPPDAANPENLSSAMRRYTPRRGVTAPRWFVAALLGGTAVLTAATAVLPKPVLTTTAHPLQIGSLAR